MSEMQELKKEADEQYVIQRYQELNEYIDKLWEEIEYCYKRSNDSWIIYGVAWLAWVIVGFVDESWQYGFAMIFLLSLCYQSYRQANLSRAHGKFQGAIRVMRILQMIPPPKDGGMKKRKRTWNEGLEIVRGWFKAKKEAQDKAYAPA